MRIIGNRKAVSGSISAMFVVLIFLIAASSVFSYHLTEDRYNQLVNERSQRDWERYNERLLISSATRALDAYGTGTLNASIQNIGAVAAHLVTLYVSAYDASTSPQWQQQYSIDIWISPGTVKYSFGQNPFTYTPITPGYINQPVSTVALNYANLTYVIKLVTERGNIATYIVVSPEQEGTQYPGVPMIPGTTQINLVDPSIESYWRRPYIEYSVLHTQLVANKLWVRAKFVNTGSDPITIDRGSILYQICASPSNKKVLGFGGRIYNGTATWNPGQQVTIVFRCGDYTWQTLGELASIFNTGENEVAWTGTAGFTTHRPTGGEVFYSGAAVVDGLLVYRTS
jgi:hypothetical protein